MKTLQNLLPRYARKPLISFLILQILVFWVSRLATTPLYHRTFETVWDHAIPFAPWTVLIYVGAFPFWAFGILLCTRFDEERGWQFFCADAIAKIVCLICFVLLPTTNTRPMIEGSGLWEQGMKLIYFLDPADNLFPSIHCLLSWLCYLGVRKEERISKFWRCLFLIFALMVFASTLTTKQHVIVDVLAGWTLASGSYWLAGHTKIRRFYKRLF